MPSNPSLRACLKIISPSLTMCSLNWMRHWWPSSGDPRICPFALPKGVAASRDRQDPAGRKRRGGAQSYGGAELGNSRGWTSWPRAPQSFVPPSVYTATYQHLFHRYLRGYQRRLPHPPPQPRLPARSLMMMSSTMAPMVALMIRATVPTPR
jgi:hypothetical protein